MLIGGVLGQVVVVVGAGRTALALGRARRVDARGVGVAAAQRARRDVQAVLRLDRPQPRDLELGRVARGDELVRAEVADRDLDALRPVAHRAPVVGELVDAEADPPAPPHAAVELVEVLGLPVRGLARRHAQQLAAVTGPVEPGVGVVPAERGRLRGRRLQRPGLVVEDRRVAVEHGRGDQRGERGQDREGDGGRRVRPAQLLQPQEGDDQQREDRAAEELDAEADRDHRDDVEHEQREQREPREPEPVRGAARTPARRRSARARRRPAGSPCAPSRRARGRARARRAGRRCRARSRPPARSSRPGSTSSSDTRPAISISAASGISAAKATSWRLGPGAGRRRAARRSPAGRRPPPATRGAARSARASPSSAAPPRRRAR